MQKEAKYYDVTEKYEKLNMLGKGKFSTVYLCKSKSTGEYAAMKLIDKQHLTPKEREFLRDEIQIFKSICHPNVVEMYDVFETKENMYILMERVEGGELFDHIKETEITGNNYIYFSYLCLEKQAALIVS